MRAGEIEGGAEMRRKTRAGERGNKVRIMFERGRGRNKIRTRMQERWE